MDDYSQVVQGEGVGEVGDDDEDGGGQERGQHAAHQGAGKLKNHQKPKTILENMYFSEKISRYSPQKRQDTYRFQRLCIGSVVLVQCRQQTLG